MNGWKNVSMVMKPYVSFVLKRDHIPYQCEPDKENYKFWIPISNRRFTEVLEDALCEKQRRETWSKTPVYSLRTLRNSQKMKRLIHLNGRKGFRILRQDKEKYMQYYG